MRRFHYDQIDSTNSRARRLMADNPGEVLLVTAATQSAGRGRMGRQWSSPRGGAWMSLVWPARRAAEHYQTAPLIAAIAAHRTIAESINGGPLAQIKWPNDILLNGRKIAGVLCERFLRSNSNGEAGIIVGVGINADFEPAELPPDLHHSATTLRRELGRSVNVAALFDRFSDHLTQLLSAFEVQGLVPDNVQELRRSLVLVRPRDASRLRKRTAPFHVRATPLTVHC